MRNGKLVDDVDRRQRELLFFRSLRLILSRPGLALHPMTCKRVEALARGPSGAQAAILIIRNGAENLPNANISPLLSGPNDG